MKRLFSAILLALLLGGHALAQEIRDTLQAAVKTIQSEKLPVDILVNIAGMTKDALFRWVKATPSAGRKAFLA